MAKRTSAYRLTARTFPNWDEANEFVNENIEADKWVWVEHQGINMAFAHFFDAEGRITVVFAKKIRRKAKPITRTYCQDKLDKYGIKWNATVCFDEQGKKSYCLEHDRTGRVLKGSISKSWRGLNQKIEKLMYSYLDARFEGIFAARRWEEARDAYPPEDTSKLSCFLTNY